MSDYHEPRRDAPSRRVAHARLQEVLCPARVGDRDLQRSLARLVRRNTGLMRRTTYGTQESRPEGKQGAKVGRATGHLGAVPLRACSGMNASRYPASVATACKASGECSRGSVKCRRMLAACRIAKE